MKRKTRRSRARHMPRSKVAMLPRTVRAEIAARLADGHSFGAIVKWLNRLASVKAALRREFPGKRDPEISSNNLSVWRYSHPPELDIPNEIRPQA